MLPRIPLTKEAKDFWAFSDAGRQLAEWHLNYETVEPWPVEEIHDKLDLGSEETYKVQKMTFARPTAEQKAAGAKWDKTRIIYNSHVTIAKIPLEAYDYVVNGKPAIEWIIERYQVTRDKDSGIVNDPNDWCKEHNQPRYIIDLIGRVVRVSMETMKIVKTLPALNERKDGATGMTTSLRPVVDRAREAVHRQFGDDSAWQDVTAAVMELLKTRTDRSVSLADIDAIARSQNRHLNDVLAVLGLLSRPESGVLTMEYVRMAGSQRTTIPSEEVARQLRAWWRDKTLSMADWESWARSVNITWRVATQEEEAQYGH